MTAESVSVLQVCSARDAVYGAAKSLVTLSKAQRAAGSRVEFLTFAGRNFGAQMEDLGFKTHRVKVRGKIDPVAIKQMLDVIKQGHFDVVHTHLSTSSVNGCLAARAAKVPCVATVHGMSGRLSFAPANHLIGVSNGVKKHLIGQGVPDEKISVVYNGIEIRSKEDRAQARRRLEIPNHVPVLGTVSRITAMKGIEDAIHAVSQLRGKFPDLQYVIVGDGDFRANCETLAAKLGIRQAIHFVGYQEDVDSYLAAMDLFVFPSHKEAMGIALVEAMAAGLPAVATEIGGIPEVVTPQTGILVPSRKPEAFAEAVTQLLTDPSLMAQMGTAAEERAKQVFSISAMESATDAVYRRLIGFQPRLAASPRQAAVPQTLA